MPSLSSRASLACATAAVALAISCSTFPALTSGTCGNGVVEPDNGEDCDTFATSSGAACRAPGVVGACRFDCSASTDSTHACPRGFGCGHDGICRTGSGKVAS